MEIIERENINTGFQNSTQPGASSSFTKKKDLPAEMKYTQFPLLNMLNNAADSKSQRKKGGYSYNHTLKQFGCHAFITGGRTAYDTIAANPPLPSISTISRAISNSSSPVVEGECRVDELKSFLVVRNLPLSVWLSEDATRIINSVQYDPKTNQLVGCVLPLDANGMPKTKTFIATSAAVIEKLFKERKSASLLCAIIVQPLLKDSPSFCLCLFGTDNKFYTEDITNRWRYIVKLLLDASINVVGISSDGDSRLLKAMIIVSGLGITDPNLVSKDDNGMILPVFKAKLEPNIIVTQDTVHIGTKLRARLLRNSNLMPMGDFIVSVTHIKSLVKIVSKGKHLLTEKDVPVKDKINFTAVMKRCDPKIWALLEENIPGSGATRAYLRLMYYAVSSYLSEAMDVKDRVYYIWYCVFFLRIWRAWLRSKKQYSLTANFITRNAYVWIELNAHSLVSAIIQKEKSGISEPILPWLFSSQTCESFFRQLRSMTSTLSTMVNFATLKCFRRISRIQVQSDISASKYNDEELLNFPRIKNLCASFESQDFEVSFSDASVDFIFDQLTTSINYAEVKNILNAAKRDAHLAIQNSWNKC